MQGCDKVVSELIYYNIPDAPSSSVQKHLWSCQESI